MADAAAGQRLSKPYAQRVTVPAWPSDGMSLGMLVEHLRANPPIHRPEGDPRDPWAYIDEALGCVMVVDEWRPVEGTPLTLNEIGERLRRDNPTCSFYADHSNNVLQVIEPDPYMQRVQREAAMGAADA